MNNDATRTPNILVVDDEPDIRSLLQEILEDEGYDVVTAENGAAARQAHRKARPDLVLLDIWMPDVDGITLLKEWNEEGGARAPVIMMSGHGTVETAVEATRLGAYDYIEKPLSLAKLLVTVDRALQVKTLQKEHPGMRLRPADAEPVGKSTVMQKLREQARRIAQHDTPVLLTGEAGSGKVAFARYIHHASARRGGPFVELSMAALMPREAVTRLYGEESEGGVRRGLLEEAAGGTLLLKDLGEMDPALQARLLGTIESGRYHRVGGTDPLTLDVRLLAATDYDLDERVRSGGLRADLYYHLKVVPFHIPPLREHCGDVPDLLNYYIDYLSAGDRLTYRSFTVAAQNRLRNYPWPGNVRELKNLVQQLMIMGEGDVIDVEEVEKALSSSRHNLSNQTPVAFDLPLRQAREQFERAYFEHLLRVHEGSINTVARFAGIERTHLYRKLRALGIHPRSTTER